MTKPKAAHVWDKTTEEWYVEPEPATRQLLAAEPSIRALFDPCCGGGNIPRAGLAEGREVLGSDLVERNGARGQSWFLGGSLPYQGWGAQRFPNIVCNPPFFHAKGTEDFIRWGLGHVAPDGLLCVFATLAFLGGNRRTKRLWLERPPTRIWVITPRPSCPPGEVLEAGGKAEGDTKDYCWLVWQVGAPPAPAVIGWLT